VLEFLAKSYFGEFDCTVDSQRRIALPSQWRRVDQRDNNFVLFPGRFDSLALVPADMVDDMIASLRKLSFANPKAFVPMANIGSRAQVCKCDKQGRFAIGQGLLAEAGIEGKATLVGAVTFIQIWKPDSWQVRKAESGEGLDVIQTIQEGNADLPSLLSNLGG
jgi:division/cell wall cluster transcriptional repressor MraZ